MKKNTTSDKQHIERLKLSVNLSKEQIYYYVLALFGVLVIAAATVMLQVAFMHSDTAGAILLGQSQMEEKTLFPQDYVYGQEVPLVGNSILVGMFSSMTGNLLLGNILSGLVLMAFLIAALYLFNKYVLLDKKIFVLILAMVFGGLIGGSIGGSNPYFQLFDLLFIQQGYVLSLIFTLLGLALFPLSVDEGAGIKDWRWFIALCALIAFLTTQSIRFLIVLVVPLILAWIVLFTNRYRKAEWKEIIKNLKWLILHIIIIGLFVVIGMLLARIVQAQATFIKEAVQTSYQTTGYVIYNLALDFFMQIFYYFGFRLEVSLFSVHGIFNVIAVVCAAILVFILPTRLLMKYKEQPYQIKILMIFNLISFLLTFLLYAAVQNMARPRYMIFNLFFCVVLSTYYIWKYLLKKTPMVRLLSFLFVALFVLVGCANTVSVLRQSESLSEQRYNLIRFLEEKDLHYGYAAYWNAGANTVLSNNDVTIASMRLDQAVPSPRYILTKKSYYDYSKYTGRTFLIFNENLDPINKHDLNRILGKPVEKYTFTTNYLSYTHPETFIITAANGKNETIDLSIYVYDYNIAEKLSTVEPIIGGTKNITSGMFGRKDAQRKNGEWILPKGSYLYGPYASYQKGEYELIIDVENVKDMIPLTISGTEAIISLFRSPEEIKGMSVENINMTLVSGENRVVFSLDDARENLEFVIRNTTEEEVVIKSIEVKKIS